MTEPAPETETAPATDTAPAAERAGTYVVDLPGGARLTYTSAAPESPPAAAPDPE